MAANRNSARHHPAARLSHLARDLIGSFSAIAISTGVLTVQGPAIAIGTTLAALAGARLINYWSYGTKTFFTPLGIARFVLIAFVPTAMLSTAGAISGQLFNTEFDFNALAVTTAIWWLTDAVASMIIAPVIVLWATPPLRASAKLDLPETAGIILAAAAIGAIAFLPVTVGRSEGSTALPKHLWLSHFAAVDVG